MNLTKIGKVVLPTLPLGENESDFYPRFLSNHLIQAGLGNPEFESNNYKKLFLRTINEIIEKNNLGKISIEELHALQFENDALVDSASIGSQAIIMRTDFTNIDLSKRYGFVIFSPSESISKYKATFGFISKRVKDPETLLEQKITQPIILLDDAFFKVVEENEIPFHFVEIFFNNYFFMQELADHDYIHELFLGLEIEEQSGIKYSDESTIYGAEVEAHALALHAQVLKSLFAKNPRRKEIVLNKAVESFNIIFAIQHLLLRKKFDELEITHIVTYMAEVISHKFFRCIDPREDSIGVYKIRDAINKLSIMTKSELYDECVINQEFGSAFEELLLNLSAVSKSRNGRLFPDFYSKLHYQKDTFIGYGNKGEIKPDGYKRTNIFEAVVELYIYASRIKNNLIHGVKISRPIKPYLFKAQQ